MAHKNEASLTIHLGGSSHQIDANTLINELIHVTTIINTANDEYGQGGRKININVNALEKGSFIIDLSVVERFGELIFSNSSIGYAASLVTIVGGIFHIYKHFKGRRAKKEEVEQHIKDIKISPNITIQQITNIYNAPVIREAISKTIETAEADINVENINICGTGLDKITIERDEFGGLIYDDFANENHPPQTIEEETEATLAILAMRFESGGKWLFGWNGIRISMTVKDDALIDQINKGARFGKGDSIRVKMKVTKTWNKEYNFYENKSYKIIEFFEHIIPSIQISITE